MVDYEIHDFRGSYLSFYGREMVKYAISRQNSRIGTDTESRYRYLWTETKWYRYPCTEKGWY